MPEKKESYLGIPRKKMGAKDLISKKTDFQLKRLLLSIYGNSENNVSMYPSLGAY